METIFLIIQQARSLVEPFAPVFKALSSAFEVILLALGLYVARRISKASEEVKTVAGKLEVQIKAMKADMSSAVDDMDGRLRKVEKRFRAALTGVRLPEAASVSGATSSQDSAFGDVGGSEEELDRRWEQVRSIWKNTRDDVSALIDHLYDTEDGRRMRRLDNIDFRNYSKVAEKLYQGDWINHLAFESLQALDAKFKALRTTQAVSSADLNEMQLHRSAFNKSKPKTPDQPVE